MTTFSTLPDATLAQDKPLTQSIARALRDNPIAYAEADSTAPEVVGVSPMMKVTASTSSSLVFSNLPDGYDALEFDVVRIMPTSGSAGQLRMEVSTDNGATWISSNYKFNIFYQDNLGTGVAFVNGSYFLLSANIAMLTGPASGLNGRLTLRNCSTAASLKMIESDVSGVVAGPNVARQSIFGYQDATATLSNKITAVRFTHSTGTIASGYITMRRVRPA